MYSGEPTFTFGMRGAELGVVAKPKSAILVSPYLSNILAGFKSLWTMPTWIFLIPLYFIALYP